MLLFLASSVSLHDRSHPTLFDGHRSWWELYWDPDVDKTGSGPFLKLDYEFVPGGTFIRQSYIGIEYAIELLSLVGHPHVDWLRRYGTIYDLEASYRHSWQCPFCNGLQQLGYVY